MMIAHTAAIALLLFLVIVTPLTHPRSDPNHNNNNEDIVVSFEFANTNTKPTQRSLLRGVRRVLPHWLGLDGFHANANNNLFIKDSNFDEEAISKAASPSEEEMMIKEGKPPDVPKEVISQDTNNPVYEGDHIEGNNPLFDGGLRGRRLPHMVTFDGLQYDVEENSNLFVDGETMVKEGDQPTGENVDESIVVPKDELSGSVEDSSLGLPDGTIKSVLVEEDKPVIDSTKIHDTTPPSAPLEDTEPEAIAIAELQQDTEEEENETYKLKDVIITSVLCEKAKDIQTTTQAIEFDEELPYFVKVIACGIGWGWYWNWDETPPTTLKDQEPITWLVSEKSLGTNYGGGNKIIWEAEADDFIWEDEAEDFRIGSIIRSKADGILKVKKHPGEPDIDILIDSDGSLFEDKWPDMGDYDLVAKRIWGEESGDFIVKLIWEAEADDFIIQVGNKVTYSVKYDDIEKKGVIVKK